MHGETQFEIFPSVVFFNFHVAMISQRPYAGESSKKKSFAMTRQVVRDFRG